MIGLDNVTAAERSAHACALRSAAVTLSSPGFSEAKIRLAR